MNMRQIAKDLLRYQVKLEVYGRAYTITKSAPSYYELVQSINKEFGNVLILETIDLD